MKNEYCLSDNYRAPRDFYRDRPVYCSNQVLALIEAAAEDENSGKGYEDVVGDICFMSLTAGKRLPSNVSQLDFGVTLMNAVYCLIREDSNSGITIRFPGESNTD